MTSNIIQQTNQNHDKLSVDAVYQLSDEKVSMLENFFVIADTNLKNKALRTSLATTEPVEHLNLKAFKHKPCMNDNEHNYKQCPYYHNFKDRRREGAHYRPDLCEFAENPEKCQSGDGCILAHTQTEQLYHTENYKTKFCQHYPFNVNLCEYGTFCPFAHCEQDVRIDLIHYLRHDEDFSMFHYKTVWCPFKFVQHEKSLCVYAHDMQDYRRKPQIYCYEPLLCPAWRPDALNSKCGDRCPLKENCQKCHGCKEFGYHPMNFKTMLCSNKDCHKDSHCPYCHQQEEKRTVSTNVKNKVFTLVPRNRIAPEILNGSKSPLHQNEQSTILNDRNIDCETSNELFSEEQLKLKFPHKTNYNAMDEELQNPNGIPNRDLKESQGQNVMDSIDFQSDDRKSRGDSMASYHVLDSLESIKDLSKEEENDLNLSEDVSLSPIGYINHASVPYSIHDLDNPRPILSRSPRYSIEDRLEDPPQYN